MNNNSNLNVIAVIVPVYNSIKYIKRCLDSILNQQYINFKIIIINDGSNDGTESLLEEYANNNEKIVLINKANNGVANARNDGLKYALEHDYPFICFVDSDDYIENNYLYDLFNLMAKSEADCVLSVPISHHDENYYKNIKDTTLDKNNAQRILLEENFYESYSHSKLFKSSLWSGINFPNYLIMEDQATIYKVIGKSSKVLFTGYKGYHYYQNENSICHNITNEKIIDIIKGYLEAANDIQLSTSNQILAKKLFVKKLLWFVPFFNNNSTNINEYKTLLIEIKHLKLLKFKYCRSFKEKLKLFLFKYVRHCYFFLFKLSNKKCFE